MSTPMNPITAAMDFLAEWDVHSYTTPLAFADAAKVHIAALTGYAAGLEIAVKGRPDAAKATRPRPDEFDARNAVLDKIRREALRLNEPPEIKGTPDAARASVRVGEPKPLDLPIARRSDESIEAQNAAFFDGPYAEAIRERKARRDFGAAFGERPSLDDFADAMGDDRLEDLDGELAAMGKPVVVDLPGGGARYEIGASIPYLKARHLSDMQEAGL